MKFPAAVLLAACLPLSAFAGVKASSEGTSNDGDRLSAKYAVDGKLSTAWAEGADGDGVGEWLEITLDRTTDVRSISIWPGKLDKGSRGLREYGRPHTVTVTLLGAGEEVSKEVRVLDIAETGPTRVDVSIEGKARKVRISLDQVYGGGIRSDTYLTEVAVNFASGDSHPSVDKFTEWRGGTAGTRAREAFAAELETLKSTIAESEFGERDLFDQIKSAASDGIPAEQKRAQTSVPDGFRTSAVPPHRGALNALLELDDPNAIAALELAATRTTGELSANIQDRVSRFKAMADLKGGNKRNVKPFGESGWCKGCLRTFGEPLGVAADGFGSIWLADLANNRVQQFTFDGISKSTIGQGDAMITSNWLGSKREWYASAHTPSTAPGGFALPVAITTIPAKTGDTLLVLDAAGRVQHLNAGGQVIDAWKLEVELPLSPRVGGEGHLAVAKGNVMVAWGDEAFVFNLKGEQHAAFTLEDGVAEGLVGFKNGKFGVLHEGDLIRYSADGFRYGGMLGDTVPKGFEYLAVTMDELGKLWVITDTGKAIKYKKPGKVDFEVQLSEFSYGVPRAAVYQDLVFLTDADTIKRYDALQMHQAAMAAE